jgi:hypothetical protein
MPPWHGAADTTGTNLNQDTTTGHSAVHWQSRNKLGSTRLGAILSSKEQQAFHWRWAHTHTPKVRQPGAASVSVHNVQCAALPLAVEAAALMAALASDHPTHWQGPQRPAPAEG